MMININYAVKLLKIETHKHLGNAWLGSSGGAITACRQVLTRMAIYYKFMT